MSQDLERRIERLEAESEIRRLKARYLNACDSKDVPAIRACFVAEAEIDFPPIGKFGLDGLIEIFTQMAADTPITDVHQGHNAEIEILDADHAAGIWNLGFFTYDPRARTFRMLASFYKDSYVRTPAGWRIAATQSIPRAIVDGTIGPEGLSANWIQSTV